jgi:hypothetical protein
VFVFFGHFLVFIGRQFFRLRLKALRGDIAATAAVLFVVAIMLWFMS